MKQLIILFLILLLPSVTAYEAIITVTGTITSPSVKGGGITALNPTMRIYDNPPTSGLSPIENGEKSDQGAFSKMLSKKIQIESGKKYYITMQFQGFCTQLNAEVYLGYSTSCSNLPCPSKGNGGCWGFCQSGDDNNYQKNKYTEARCFPITGIPGQSGRYCKEVPDTSDGPCNTRRDDQYNPVHALADSPGPAILGDDDVLIEFAAP